MLDAAGHDKVLARPQLDDPIAELDTETALPDEEHFVAVVVPMPREHPLHLHRLDLLAIEAGDHLGPPLLGEGGELGCDVALLAQFSAPVRAPVAAATSVWTKSSPL